MRSSYENTSNKITLKTDFEKKCFDFEIASQNLQSETLVGRASIQLLSSTILSLKAAVKYYKSTLFLEEINLSRLTLFLPQQAKPKTGVKHNAKGRLETEI